MSVVDEHAWCTHCGAHMPDATCIHAGCSGFGLTAAEQRKAMAEATAVDRAPTARDLFAAAYLQTVDHLFDPSQVGAVAQYARAWAFADAMIKAGAR